MSVGARSADSLVESIGVNVHLGYSGTVYDRFTRIQAALERLGVRYVRDGISQGRPDLNTRLHRLAADGIRLDAIVGDPLGRFGSGSLKQQLRLISRQLGVAVVASLEGPNEFDISGARRWLPILRSYTRRLWRLAHGFRNLASIPILGPTIVDPANRGRLGSISAWTSEGNMHPYPGGNTPDSDSHMESEFALAAQNTGSQRVQATETGYTNAVNAREGQLPTSERAAGIYMPRLFLDNFRRGITRTYAYELIDPSSDPRHTNSEADFGLLRHDFSPKPAFTAVANLISILEDPGSRFTPGSLSYDITGAADDLRQVLLQKRDGSFYLALWNAASAWDPVARASLDLGRDSVAIHFGSPIALAQVLKPNDSPHAVTTAANPSSLDLRIGPEVTLLKLLPGTLVPPTIVLSQTLPVL